MYGCGCGCAHWLIDVSWDLSQWYQSRVISTAAVQCIESACKMTAWLLQKCPLRASLLASWGVTESSFPKLVMPLLQGSMKLLLDLYMSMRCSSIRRRHFVITLFFSFYHLVWKIQMSCYPSFLSTKTFHSCVIDNCRLYCCTSNSVYQLWCAMHMA